MQITYKRMLTAYNRHQKTAETAALRDVQLGTLDTHLSTKISIPKPLLLSRAVEVGGIEPPDISLTSECPHQATPTADLLYHNFFSLPFMGRVREG